MGGIQEIMIPGLGKENELETRFHSLFVEEVEAETMTISLEGAGLEEVLGSSTLNIISTPAHHKFSLYASDFMHDENEMHAITHKLRSADEYDELELRIGSYGGQVLEGIILLGVMREFFNGNTTTYNEHDAISMGALMFCSGDRRIAYEYSTLMIHDYSGGTFGNSGKQRDQLEHTQKNLHRLFRDVFLAKGFIDEKEFLRAIDGKDLYFDTLDMAKRGIATDIVRDGFTIPAEDYIEFRESGMEFDEYKEYKELEYAEEEGE